MDLLLERNGKILAAFEIKSGRSATRGRFAGLRAFAADTPGVELYVISELEDERMSEGIKVINWKSYLELLKTNC